MSNTHVKPLSKSERLALLTPLINTGWDYRYSAPPVPTPSNLNGRTSSDSYSLLTFPAIVSSAYDEHHENEALFRTYVFADFVGAFSFMTQVALHAERLQHHPEWHNVYNKVNVSWRTHDVNGISPLDVEMAELCDQLYSKYAI